MTGGDQGFDPYETLGVTRLATADDVRLAYRHLVKRFHPDLHPGDTTLEDRIRQINEAYAILSDPERRAALEAEPEFDEVPKPKARPQRPPERARSARRAAAARAEAERTKAERRAAQWRKSARFLFHAALILGVGTLLVRLLHPVHIALALQEYVQGSVQAAAIPPAPDPRLATPADTVYHASPPRAKIAPAAAPPPPVRAASDPCGPGTVCYDRRTYGRSGWYIRRGHGSDHPT